MGEKKGSSGGPLSSSVRALTDTGGDSRPWPRFLRACRAVVRRFFHGVVRGVGQTVTPRGLYRIAAVHAVVASVFLGGPKAAKVALGSLATVLVTSTALAMRTAPQSGMAEEFLKGISAGDSAGFIASLVGLMDVFDKVFDTFPELNRPALAALRECAQEELLLRFLTASSIHMRMAPHPGGPETAARDFMGPQRTDSGSLVKRSNADGDEDEMPPGDDDDAAGREHVTLDVVHDEDASLLRGFKGIVDAQSAQVGDEAAAEDLEEFKFFVPWAEATYYEMTCLAAIQKWIKERGDAQMVYAQVESTPKSPAHAVAVHEERQELIVLVRGTETASDAITDMIVTPERWGDDEHIVHSGIGTSTDRLYERLHATAGAFHESGYSIRLVGHSLGAGVCALLAWLLKRDGLERVRATCFAPPACASPAIAEETKEYVNSLVMRYDAVPRIKPKTVVALEEELLSISWEEMDTTCREWGALGRTLYRRAKHRHDETSDERKELEEEFREDPPEEGVNGDADVMGGGGGELNANKKKQDGQDQTREDAGGEEDQRKGQEGGGDGEEGPPKLSEPTVCGKVTWLRPANKAAIMFGADDKDLRREGVKPSEEEEERIRSQMDDNALRAKLSDEQKFDARVVPANAVTLCTMRLAAQAFQDHFLDQYRTGLGMPIRTVYGEFTCADE